MREEYRELLRPLGIVPETVYLATDRATALQRISARAAGQGDDFQLSTQLAAAYFDHFEPPTEAEGPLTVMQGKDEASKGRVSAIETATVHRAASQHTLSTDRAPRTGIP